MQSLGYELISRLHGPSPVPYGSPAKHSTAQPIAPHRVSDGRPTGAEVALRSPRPTPTARRAVMCGPLAALFARRCGPSAVSIPANIPESPRIQPPPPPTSSRLFAGIRGNSQTYGISGRTVQIGLVMRFLRLLRSLCGPKSRVVPAPGAGLACGPRPWDGRWPRRASRAALLVSLHQRQLVRLGSCAGCAPVLVGPPHEDEPSIGSLAKRDQHASRLRSHG